MSNKFNQTVDNDLIDRYFAGECEPEEAEIMQDWLEYNPAFLTIKNKFSADNTAVSSAMKAEDWTRIQRTVLAHKTNQHEVVTSQSEKSFTRAIFQRWTIAPALAVLIGIFSWFGYTNLTSTHKIDESRVFITKIGERATVNLADGSSVMLGPSSTLTVDGGYNKTGRSLKLKGSGFFSVVSSSSIPFKLSARNAEVLVLGTSFGVRAYEDEDDVVVAVRDGRVSVSDNSRDAEASVMPPLVASANEVARLNSQSVSVSRRDGDSKDMIAWTEGRLMFKDVPLQKVLDELSRWYEITFEVSDAELRAIPITGAFSSQSLDEIPDALAFIIPVRVIREGQTVKIIRK